MGGSGGGTGSDTVRPSIAITVPTSSGAYTTTSASVTLQGTASDNVGVTRVSWTNSSGGAGTATGTTNWTASGIALQPGSNVLTLTAFDAAVEPLREALDVPGAAVAIVKDGEAVFAKGYGLRDVESGETFEARGDPRAVDRRAADRRGGCRRRRAAIDAGETVRRRLSELVEHGFADRQGDGKRGDPHRWSVTENGGRLSL